jgi:transcriptional regulator with XRE-family HTH domain
VGQVRKVRPDPAEGPGSGEALREWRERRGWSSRDAAAATGVDAGLWRNAEAGRRELGRTARILLAFMDK